MPCIYCGADADGREHWIPRGLGAFNGDTALFDRLCEQCNQRLGRELVEEFLQI
jgi:HNH endonuclease